MRAAADEQDAAIYLTAAFTGLRCGELIALRWRTSTSPARWSAAARATRPAASPTLRTARSAAVPLAPRVAEALARLGQRNRWTSEDDLVCPSGLGGYLDGSALRRRYLAVDDYAGLRLGWDETGQRTAASPTRFRAHPNTIKQLGPGEAIVVSRRPTFAVRCVVVRPALSARSDV